MITVSGPISIDDADNDKEPVDLVNTYYVLDGGTKLLFGCVSDDISAQTFTVTGLSGSTVQILVESDVTVPMSFIPSIILSYQQVLVPPRTLMEY